MTKPQEFVAVAITHDARKKLKHLSAEREESMCRILSALIDYAAQTPAFVAEILQPACERPVHGH